MEKDEGSIGDGIVVDGLRWEKTVRQDVVATDETIKPITGAENMNSVSQK